MATFDCENCKDIFNLVSAYNVGMIDKNKVNDFVRAKGIKPSDYVESIRKVLEDKPFYSSKASVMNEDINSATEHEGSENKPFFHYISRRRRR